MNGNTNGGLAGGNAVRVSITNNVFHNLTAGEGAAISVFYSTNALVITNNLFYRNHVTNDGGIVVLYNFWQGTGKDDLFQNNTMVDNVADGSGDNDDRITGLKLTAKEMINPIMIRNNLFAGPRRQIRYSGDMRDGAVYYSKYENNAFPETPGSIVQNAAVITTAPGFVNAGNPLGADGLYMTQDDGYRLQASSPCVNKGSTSGIAATDILGNARNQSGGVDIGCYESGNGSVGVQPGATGLSVSGRPLVTIAGRAVQVSGTGGATHEITVMKMNGAVITRFSVQGDGVFNPAHLPTGAFLVKVSGPVINLSRSVSVM